MRTPTFLTLAEGIETHSDQVRRYGGEPGLRDRGLLESALARPEASFGGEWLHEDPCAMAAAYAYPLCQNHCFIDGNKRTALACSLVFLELNGVSLLDPKGRLREAMGQVASGRLEKTEMAELFRRLPRQ